MKKNLTFVLVLLSVVLFVFLGIALGRYTSSALVAEAPNPACMSTMTDIIASAQGDVYNMGNDPDYVEPESYYLATYSVKGNAITDPTLESVPNDLLDEQKDSVLQTEAWNLFTDLIPAEDRKMVAQYNVFTDGFENTLAAVDQKKNNPSQWILEVDLADLQNKDALMFTIIHEYAHLLTLNASQVTPDQEIVDDPYNLSLQTDKAAACPNYFTGTGCSHADSYVHAFYNRFWVDINDEWAKVDALQYETEDLTPYYDGLYGFYKTHQDQFLDDYSTTHPTEDIAESFTYFVFSPKPTGDSIKEQKIAFFYEYPELVRLREDILNGACSAK